METTGLEPGMNYYINDVLTEMDPKCNVDEREKCKNLKVCFLIYMQGLCVEGGESDQ